MLKYIDIFSGIGGFSLALQPEFKCVSFCDSDADAQAVLRSQMSAGHIPHARIFKDVLAMSVDDIDRHKPFLVTMGFPCQDISALTRNAKGVHGSRSKLVFHVLNLLSKSKHVRMVLHSRKLRMGQPPRRLRVIHR